MRRFRIRIDDVNDAHVRLTFFTLNRSGSTWQNCGTLTVGRDWFDESPLAGAPEGKKVEATLDVVADAVLQAGEGDLLSRRDLLARMREHGLDPTDVKLTESGHDFIVSLDSMERFFRAGQLLGESITAVHLAVHRGATDDQLRNDVVDLAKRAGLWPLDPPSEAS